MLPKVSNSLLCQDIDSCLYYPQTWLLQFPFLWITPSAAPHTSDYLKYCCSIGHHDKEIWPYYTHSPWPSLVTCKFYMALHHLICPANSPLDLTRVSDQTINYFWMFLNLPFIWNIMVIELFLLLDLRCEMPFPRKFGCVSLPTVLEYS